MLFRHISMVIGTENVRAYCRALGSRMAAAIHQSVRAHPRARFSDPSQVQRRGLVSALLECVFPGLGWFFSGRPFIGIIMFSLGTAYLTLVYIVIAVAASGGPFPVLAGLYIATVLSSSVLCYRSYLSDSRVERAQDL
jgi:hypothetical protein